MSADIASVIIDRLRRENEGQARLLAGVAERETRLLARIGELQKDKRRMDWVEKQYRLTRDAIDTSMEVVHP
jgi:hypothetical protein